MINLCSLNGVNAHMYTVHYNAAKEAVRALTRTAAREWAGYNILCNIICPAAATETYRVGDGRESSSWRRSCWRSTRCTAWATPSRTSAASRCSSRREDSRYVTGNTLFVDGGSHINGSPWAPELPEEMPR